MNRDDIIAKHADSYMEREQIIRMAREAGWTGPEDNLVYVAMLARFAALVVAAERKKLFALLRQMQDAYSLASDSNTIRARGQDPMPLFDDWNKDWTK